MSKLRILQYNVQGSKDKVMSPLLADKRVWDFDILAIQEPWANPFATTTYRGGNGPFSLAYNTIRSRTCFFINKRLNPNDWDVTFHSPDYCTAQIRTLDEVWTVHNIYSEPPGGLRVTEYNTPIPLLRPQLLKPGDHIVVGDFNLHHPWWSGVADPVQHDAATALIQTMDSAQLDLLSPVAQTTWERQNSSSNLDLAFGTFRATLRVTTCKTRLDLDHGSDHLPAETSVYTTPTLAIPKNTRRWKDIDTELVRHGAESTPMIQRGEDLDAFADRLVAFIQELIVQTVPERRPSQKAVEWWCEEVSEAIRTERTLRRAWRDSGLDHDWEALRTASDSKKRVIKRAKTRTFRAKVHEMSTSTQGVWGLAKWARTKGGDAPEMPTMPPLLTPDGTMAHSRLQKEEALKARFFPTPRANTRDIVDHSYLIGGDAETGPIPEATTEEIKAAIRSQKPKGAPGTDAIPPLFLQAMGEPLVQSLTGLTSECWRKSHFPGRFKQAITLCLKKPGKADYGNPGAWRPIALLSTVGKVIEKATAIRLRDLAESGLMLPKQQMGARPGRSTISALELLTEQVHTIWGTGKNVASLLSLDISGAFDSVDPRRLLDNLSKRKVPVWIIRWTQSFLSDRSTTLSFGGRESAPFRILGGSPQGSPLSPILYLFYNADLIEACEGPRTTGIGFVDDCNILAYGKSTEGNCQALESVHNRCLAWADRHGASFAPQKYELIHFSRRRTAFNMAHPLRLGTVTNTPKAEVRILGVWLDPKLNWSKQAAQVKKREPGYERALNMTANSTWGATFSSARQIYSAMIRPSITYGSEVWHRPGHNIPKGLAAKLSTTQSKALRKVAGTYKATRSDRVEAECGIPPLHLYLDQKQASHYQRTREAVTTGEIRTACEKVFRRLRRRRTLQRTPTEREAKTDWADGRSERIRTLQEMPEERKVPAKHRLLWREWHHNLDVTRRRYEPVETRLDPGFHKRHSGLRKAESSALIQLRTGVTGLNGTLSRLRVPGVVERCSCRTGTESVSHFLLWCPNYAQYRHLLPASSGGIRTLLTQHGSEAAKWLIRSGRLPQFSLANTLLYN